MDAEASGSGSTKNFPGTSTRGAGEAVARISARQAQSDSSARGLPKDFALYTLRRSFATLATAAGASRLGRSVQMGHGRPSVHGRGLCDAPAEYAKVGVGCARKPSFFGRSPTFRTF